MTATGEELESGIDRLLSRYPDLQECASDISEAFALLLETFRSGGKLLLCGNGGSAADCEHIAGELMKGFLSPRRLGEDERLKLAAAVPGEDDADYLHGHLQGALPAISLVSQSGLITAVNNDIAADMIFAQQVYGYGREGDALLAISTSGNSPGVIRAIQTARAFGLRSIALTGQSGGGMAPLCDVSIRVPYDATHLVQERHLPIYHTLCIMLEEAMFP